MTAALGMEATLSKGFAKVKEKIPLTLGHSAQAGLDTPVLQARREDKTAPGWNGNRLDKGVPPGDGSTLGKQASHREGNLGEKKKPGTPAVLDHPMEKKKQELSLKLEDPGEKKVAPSRASVRILSSGQPMVSSPNLLEIPLNLALETSGKSYPLSLTLSINLEQVAPDI